jgi:hypothetical protein
MKWDRTSASGKEVRVNSAAMVSMDDMMEFLDTFCSGS